MSQKKGPPVHQNREKWVPERADKHSSMREKVERDLAQPGGGVCQKCRDVIQWKKDYGKYKPLRAPAKCTHCNQRVITHAYHMLCLGCANSKNVCAKCGEDRPLHDEDPFEGKPKPPSPDELALMNERQRRTAIRKYEKALDDEKAAKRAAMQGITVEELRQREAAEREARGQPIAELVQDVDKMLHPKLFRAAPPPTAPPVAPAPPTTAPPRPTATTAESTYASLEKMGHPASLCAPVDASDQARWSDRDNEGRTDDEDAELPTMDSTGLGHQSRVAAVKQAVPVAKTGRKAKASVINDDDDAAVAAVEAEAASDEDEDDEDDEDEDEEDEDEDEDEDDEEDEDEDEQTLFEQLASLSHSVGAAALVRQRYPHVTAASLPVAELGFDALVERLSCEGEAAAAKADAMTDRVAAVLERASASFGDAADATAALAMALEVRFYLLSCGEEAVAVAEAEAVALVS
jgi:hypothetical protein